MRLGTIMLLLTLSISSFVSIHATETIPAKKSNANPINATTTSLLTTTQKTAPTLPLHQIYSFQTKENELFYSYSIGNKNWTIKAGQRIKGNRYASAAGLQTLPFTIGSILQYGTYKMFADISQNLAWSSILFQPFSWGVDHSRLRPAWGVRIGIEPIQTWWIKKQKSTHLGAALGYDISFYEPRFLYQRSKRNNKNSNSSGWNRWIIQKPSSTEIHHVGFSQTFRLFNSLYAQVVLSSSTSNTTAMHFAGYTLLQYFSKVIDIKLGYTQSEKNYIHQEWGFSKYLWSSSAEISMYYLHIIHQKNESPPFSPHIKPTIQHDNARIRIRAIFREYHPLDAGYRKKTSYYQKYAIDWKHSFLDTDTNLKYIPKTQYVWHLAEEYHAITNSLSIKWGQFTLSPAFSTTFFYTTVYIKNGKNTHTSFSTDYAIHHYRLEKLELKFSHKIELTVSTIRLKFFVLFTWRGQTKIEHLHNSVYLGNSTKQELETALGCSIRLESLRLYAHYKTKWNLLTNEDTLDIILDLGMRYTIK